jgi:hypothetical protein
MKTCDGEKSAAAVHFKTAPIIITFSGEVGLTQIFTPSYPLPLERLANM